MKPDISHFLARLWDTKTLKSIPYKEMEDLINRCENINKFNELKEEDQKIIILAVKEMKEKYNLILEIP